MREAADVADQGDDDVGHDRHLHKANIDLADHFKGAGQFTQKKTQGNA